MPAASSGLSSAHAIIMSNSTGAASFSPVKLLRVHSMTIFRVHPAFSSMFDWICWFPKFWISQGLSRHWPSNSSREARWQPSACRVPLPGQWVTHLTGSPARDDQPPLNSLSIHIIYMHTYIYSYIHIDIYTYIHIYIYTYLHMYIFTWIQIYIYKYWHIYFFHIYIHTYIHIFIYTYIHIYIYTYIHIYIYTYIHIYICTYLHKYIHTYIHIFIYTHLHIYRFTYLHIYIYKHLHMHIFTCIQI